MSEVKKLSEIARTVLGTIYILGAAVNLRLAFLDLNVYQEFAKFALIDLYKILWSSIVMPYLTAWLALVIIFEVSVGILILILIPFWSGWSLINLLLVLVQSILLKEEYESSIIEFLRGDKA